MNKIVVDTSVIVALINKQDIHHTKAVELISSLEHSQKDIILMDCVLVEIYSVLARRSKEKGLHLPNLVAKMKKVEKNYLVIRALPMIKQLHEKVLDLIITTDGELNYHDALIALVMKKEEIKMLATFDSDFELVEWITVINPKKSKEL